MTYKTLLTSTVLVFALVCVERVHAGSFEGSWAKQVAALKKALQERKQREKK